MEFSKATFLAIMAMFLIICAYAAPVLADCDPLKCQNDCRRIGSTGGFCAFGKCVCTGS